MQGLLKLGFEPARKYSPSVACNLARVIDQFCREKSKILDGPPPVQFAVVASPSRRKGQLGVVFISAELVKNVGTGDGGDDELGDFIQACDGEIFDVLAREGDVLLCFPWKSQDEAGLAFDADRVHLFYHGQGQVVLEGLVHLFQQRRDPVSGEKEM